MPNGLYSRTTRPGGGGDDDRLGLRQSRASKPPGSDFGSGVEA